MRTTITLACTTCKQRNYMTTKGKKKQERVEYKKFCPSCGKHTMHKEVK